MARLVLTEVADQVATITLNRPEARNALSPELMRELADAVVEVDGRDDVAVMILTGADPAFSAGVDLKRLASGEAPLAPPGDSQWFGALPPHRRPIIGAVNGPAVTGGFELALACDFLIASDRARFADTHARVGAMPGWGLTVRLPQLVGIDRARQLSFTGDYIDARRAYEWGLVNEVVPHDQLLARCAEVAASVASIPADHVREIRAMYAEIPALAGDAAWRREAEWSNRWMRERFDQARLADVREAIVERGRRQQRRP
jgi:enoyl-CoA hydratase